MLTFAGVPDEGAARAFAAWAATTPVSFKRHTHLSLPCGSAESLRRTSSEVDS